MWSDTSSLEQKASITPKGAVLLGKSVVCDGFDWGRDVAVVTHLHTDHIKQFETCLGFCQAVLVSPATKDLIMAIKGEALGLRRNFIASPYGHPYTYGDETITLYPVTHVLGSAQVLVQDEDGTRILYTGDFLFPSTRPVKADVLVTQATYGRPDQTRSYTRQTVVEQVVAFVKKELQRASVCILGSRGKLQEVMVVLRSEGVDVPFLCPSDVGRINEVCHRHGMNLGNWTILGTDTAEEVIRSGQRHIFSQLFGRKLSTLPKGVHYTKLRLSGWYIELPFYQVGPDYYVATLSDHSDFNGLLGYVSQTGAKLVLTDNYRHRAGDAISLAAEIQGRLGIKAKAMPI